MRDIGVLAAVIATVTKDARYVVAIVYDFLPYESPSFALSKKLG